ncbi:MAG: cupin domain-containing protein [Oligoflexus sp.]
MSEVYRFDQRYVVVNPKGQSRLWKPEEFWKMAFNPDHPENKADMGYLVSKYEFDKDWDSWENHPNGDEVVFCISGRMTFLMEGEKGLQEHSLLPGSFLIVSKNTWHTAQVHEPSEVLFMTWGYGTQHRSIDKK